jgi:DNA repair exonuclease SbcCD nuclease subunit
MADCHIGGWRDQKLRDLNTEAFFRAADICIEKKVDFILIAGDLFNTAIPGIDKLRDVVKRFKEFKDLDIPVYLIAGSHDYSPSGKTMLDVLEEAGLCVNVTKGKVVDKKLRLRFTVDRKTGAKITGILGRRGMLDKKFYEELDREAIEKEEGFKIFMFHTSITELKPKKMENMESSPISLLPKGFDYYAGGHVHIVEKIDMEGYRNVVYPGPLFPNNYHELEDLKGGGFYIYEDGVLARQDIGVKKVNAITIDADHMLPEQVTGEIFDRLKDDDYTDTIIMIRVSGKLENGKTGQVDFRRIYEMLLGKGAYFVIRNTMQFSSKEYEEVKVEVGTADETEERLIDEHIGQIKVGGWDREKEKDMIQKLMVLLSSEKKEGEKVYQYEARIKLEMEHLLGL